MWSVIGADGKEYGPVSERTMQEWVAQGRVTPDTVLLDASRQQIRAGSIPAFFSHREHPGLAPTMAAYPRGPVAASKSKLVALLLAFFLGGFGIHRYYLGHNNTATAMLLITVLTCGIGGIVTTIWSFVDMFLIATDGLGDANGAPLV